MGWETVDVPRGTFIGWGDRKGQHVTGVVLEYDPVGGKDFADKECPVVEVELTERAASFNKAGDRTDYDPGDVVMVTCGQVALKRAVKKADLKPGNLVKITLGDLVKVPNGTVKEFEIQVDRSHKAEPKTESFSGAATDDSEPPF